MSIQWYPGHMHKAQKDIGKVLPTVDALIEVLDARIPFSSENPLIARIRGVKPCIKLLNKSDLADPLITQLWQEHFERERQVKSLAVTVQDHTTVKQIAHLCQKLLAEKSHSAKRTRAMIVGIPNVWKIYNN